MHSRGKIPAGVALQGAIDVEDADGDGTINFAESPAVAVRSVQGCDEEDAGDNGEDSGNEEDSDNKKGAADSGGGADNEEVEEVFDEDGKGFISAAKLRDVMANLGRHSSCFFCGSLLTEITRSIGKKLTETEADEMIPEADPDGDGKINYKVFVFAHPLYACVSLTDR